MKFVYIYRERERGQKGQGRRQCMPVNEKVDG